MSGMMDNAAAAAAAVRAAVMAAARGASAAAAVILDKLSIPLLIFGIFTYVLNFVSDIGVVLRYYFKGDYWWGSCTVIFILGPWIIYVLVARWQKSAHKKNETYRRFYIASFFNMYPAAQLSHAVALKRKGDKYGAAVVKAEAKAIRIIRVALSSVPQASLQVYMSAQANHCIGRKFISITATFFSMCASFFRVTCPEVQRSEFKFALIFYPWLLFHVLSFLSPVAFFAALKNHSHPGYMACLLYFFAQLLLSTVTAVIWPTHGARALPGPFRKMSHKIPQRYHLPIRALSAFLQAVFSFISIFIASCWFVSLAPFADAASLNATFIPDFIWPNPSLPLRNWVVATDFRQSWNVCNKASMLRCLDASMLRCFDAPVYQQVSDVKGFFDREFCITDYAAPLYVLFVSASLLLFIYHILLVIFWPAIHARFFLLTTAKNLLEKSETISTLREDLAESSLEDPSDDFPRLAELSKEIREWISSTEATMKTTKVYMTSADFVEEISDKTEGFVEKLKPVVKRLGNAMLDVDNEAGQGCCPCLAKEMEAQKLKRNVESLRRYLEHLSKDPPAGEEEASSREAPMEMAAVPDTDFDHDEGVNSVRLPLVATWSNNDKGIDVAGLPRKENVGSALSGAHMEGDEEKDGRDERGDIVIDNNNAV